MYINVLNHKLYCQYVWAQTWLYVKKEYILFLRTNRNNKIEKKYLIDSPPSPPNKTQTIRNINFVTITYLTNVSCSQFKSIVSVSIFSLQGSTPLKSTNGRSFYTSQSSTSTHTSPILLGYCSPPQEKKRSPIFLNFVIPTWTEIYHFFLSTEPFS